MTLTSVFDFDILLDSDYPGTYWWTSDTEITVPIEECTDIDRWKHKVLVRVTEDGSDLGFFTWQIADGDLLLKLWYKHAK